MQGILSTHIPKRLSRQRHISTRIYIQLIRTRIPTPLSRRHVRLAEIRGTRRRTRINDLNSNSVSYTTDRAPYTTSVRHGVAGPTIAFRAARGRQACNWTLAVTFGEIDGAGACATGDIGGDIGGSGAVSTALA